MLTHTLAHLTFTEVPAALVLFATGMMLGSLVTLAFRYVRTR